MPHLLARLWALHLLVLQGTGAAARLARHGATPFAATVAGAALLLLLHAALAAGSDVRVRAFRAGTLVLALALPLLALRAPAAARPAVGGAVLLAVLASGLLHAALSTRRRESAASRALEALRLALEAGGLALFLLGATRLALGEGVPLRLAFFSLFLLRLSAADLLRPATLVAASGLPGAARADLRRAAGAGRRKRPPGPAARASHALSGAAKGTLALLWLALPFLAVLATPLVARGIWPRAALLLRLYPPLALGATAALLLLRSARTLPTAPLDAARGAVAAAASLLYLFFAYRDPAFAAYRAHLPGILLAEALFGFLLGTAARGAK